MRIFQSKVLPGNWLSQVINFNIDKSTLSNNHKIMANYLIENIKIEKEKSLVNPLSRYLIEHIIFNNEFLTNYYDNLPYKLVEDAFSEINREKGLNLTRKLHSLFTEFIIYQDLIKQGYKILNSTRENGSCDLVMSKENKTYNFEIKYKESADTGTSRLYDYIDGYSLLKENDFLRSKIFEINLKLEKIIDQNLKLVLNEIDKFLSEKNDIFDGNHIQIFNTKKGHKLNRNTNELISYIDNFHIKELDDIESLIKNLFLRDKGHIDKMIKKSKKYTLSDNFTGCLIWSLPFHLSVNEKEIEKAFNKVLTLDFDLFIYTTGIGKVEYSFIVKSIKNKRLLLSQKIKDKSIRLKNKKLVI